MTEICTFEPISPVNIKSELGDFVSYVSLNIVGALKEKIHLLTYCDHCSNFLTTLPIGPLLSNTLLQLLPLVDNFPTYPKGIPHVKDAISIGGSSFLTLLSIGSTLCHNCCHWLIILHLPQGNTARQRRDQHRHCSPDPLTYPKGIPHVKDAISIGIALLIASLTPRESRTSKTRSASALLS
jgi:hypothetical protein